MRERSLHQPHLAFACASQTFLVVRPRLPSTLLEQSLQGERGSRATISCTKRNSLRLSQVQRPRRDQLDEQESLRQTRHGVPEHKLHRRHAIKPVLRRRQLRPQLHAGQYQN